MKIRVFTAFLFGLFFYSGLINAACCNTDHKPYLTFEGGYAFSQSANIDVSEAPNPVSGFVWDHSLEGWNSNVNQSAVYGVAFGYNISKLVAVELAYNYRPSFDYQKYQTVPTSTVIGNRIRYFDLTNHTLMLNSIWHLAAIINTAQDQTRLDPFINVGAGLASNTISNFYSIGISQAPGVVFSKMFDHTKYDIAAQAGVGLNIIFNSNWAGKFGYRFIYGGKFKTQNYVLDDPDNQHPKVPGSGNAANPWTGTLKTNEIYAGLTYTFE